MIIYVKSPIIQFFSFSWPPSIILVSPLPKFSKIQFPNIIFLNNLNLKHFFFSLDSLFLSNISDIKRKWKYRT